MFSSLDDGVLLSGTSSGLLSVSQVVDRCKSGGARASRTKSSDVSREGVSVRATAAIMYVVLCPGTCRDPGVDTIVMWRKDFWI